MALSQETRPQLRASPTQTSSQISICHSKGLFALSITLPLHYSTNCPSSFCQATMTCHHSTSGVPADRLPPLHPPSPKTCLQKHSTHSPGGRSRSWGPITVDPAAGWAGPGTSQSTQPQTHGTLLLRVQTACEKGGEEARTQNQSNKTYPSCGTFLSPNTCLECLSCHTESSQRGIGDSKFWAP